MTTINGIPMTQARIRGEMSNATDYTQAEMVAWVLEDGVMGWMDHIRPLTIRLHLMQGYGSESHLFDRTAARIAEAVEGRLYESEAAARKAVKAVRYRESLQYRVEIEAGHSHHEVPAELEDAAEAIRDRIRAKDAAKDERKRAKFVRTLGVHQGEDGRYRVTTADSHHRGHWVDGISGRYWYCEGLDSRSGADYVGICGPNRGYDSAAEAEAALTAIVVQYA